jgi:sigma-B regulation protein RsbU (phosphoserine phosphatase)
MLQKPGIGIAARLIIIVTMLLCVAIGLFGLINSMQSRRIIEEYALQQVRTNSMRHLRESGSAQLRLLLKSVRMALVQSDYATLQALVHEMGTRDPRVTAVAVLNVDGMVMAHSDTRLVGIVPGGVLKRGLTAKKLAVFPDVAIGKKRSIAFAAPVTYKFAVEEVEENVEDEVGPRRPSAGSGTASHRLGTVFLALSLQPLLEQLKRTEEVAGQEVHNTLRKTLIVGLVILLVAAVLTVIQAYRMTRPIQALARQADRMAGGDLEARVAIKTRDEIGMLGQRFNYMAQRIQNLMRDTKQKAEMEKELEVARAVQATLVPAERVSQVGPLTLAGYFKPATECGGDWWNYFKLSDDHVMVIVGDVTGHGVGSAMITAAARGAASTLISGTRGKIKLKTLLHLMNGAIISTARGDFAMTCFASVYDQRRNTLTYSNAGHNPPYLFGSSSREITPLMQLSDRLGDFETARFEVEEVPVAPGDVLFWYTDGLVECTDPLGEPFGDLRFMQAIRETAHLPPEEAMDRIVEQANEHFGIAEQADDITLVVGKINDQTPGG